MSSPSVQCLCFDNDTGSLRAAVGATAFTADMFNFTPLLGAQSSSAASQSLLELDGGVKVLVDVGWDEGFDVQKLKSLER